ncbi:reverse transcriptase domain-containing protein [Tanacetum coccineum]
MAVYFVSRALRGPEINYTPMEKLVLALLSASRRLKRYFQAHTIVVITDQLIKQLLSNPEITERMLKWKFELQGYDIQYKPMISIKGQILADFIVERLEEESSNELMAEPETLLEPWNLFIDGSSYIDGSGAELILKNPEGMEFTYAMRLGLRPPTMKLSMVQYLEKVKTLISNFKEFSIKQIPRSENKKADALSKIASTSFSHLSKQVLVEELKEKSINEKEVLFIVEEEGHTWITPICEYLTKEILPEDKRKARAVHHKASRMHSDPRSVVVKAIRTGYYWPTMHTDARKLIRECSDCQVHRTIPRNPQQNLTPIMSPWPFYKWGIDIAGPFLEGPSKVKFLIVAIDYFTKWIESKPVATITGNQVKKFVWDNIVCRFGLPGEIVSDNGKLFRDNPFKHWKSSHLSCSSTRSGIRIIQRPGPTKDLSPILNLTHIFIHEQHTPTIPTSAVRNTEGRSGPQGLEEPTPDEQDKLKAVKARLLYGDESGRNPRNHEESHYSESKTPTARTEPRRRHGGGKEQSAYARSDSRHQRSQAKGTEVQPRKHQHRGTSSRGTSRYSESEDSEGGHRKS